MFNIFYLYLIVCQYLLDESPTRMLDEKLFKIKLKIFLLGAKVHWKCQIHIVTNIFFKSEFYLEFYLFVLKK